MERYKYLEHTADAKFQAFGKTLAECFTNAAYATFNILVITDEVKPNIKKDIFIEANKKESLLYDFLEELLFLLDTEGFLLNQVEILEIKELDNSYKLEAVIYGDNYKNYEIKGNIKSVTYSDMEIKDGMVQVVLDL